MKKWLLRLILIAVTGFFGLAVFDSYRGGFFNLPDMPENAYAIAFKNGMRAIYIDPDIPEPAWKNSKFFRRLSIADRDRKYLGIPVDVPSWFQDAWSFCTAPTDSERTEISPTLPTNLRRQLVNAKFEAICRLNVDGEEMVRGLLYSVPRL
jgi:hypothetical protein